MNDAPPSGGDGTFRNSFSFLVFLEFSVVNSRIWVQGPAGGIAPAGASRG